MARVGEGGDLRREGEHDQAERHVDRKDQTPVNRREQTTEQRAERGRGRRAGTPQAEGEGTAARVGIGLIDQGHRRRQNQGCGHAHQATADDEHQHGPGEGAQQRGHTEQRRAEEEHALGTELVGQAAGKQQQRGEQQRVAVDHPLLQRHVAAKVSGDGRQGHVDDHGVHAGQEERQRRGERGQPCAVAGRATRCATGLTLEAFVFAYEAERCGFVD